MSDVNLLMFGCGVSFIVISAAYIHVRRFFTSEPVRVRIADTPDPITTRTGRNLD
jgi:hypothetical protein